ncbi:hypothetical protein GALMADRAFT_228528 [Galerina marginata CBS 339.88]|uniref:F-box domain-containing protein n=1 Tax=Galerina marginata (strain CBS 339.88) TaxID=685588 RepID=A0A067SYR5_GALM3|nr:hypothetical protein GALMADRAFT_228528 [Galerina marginata CBS 339.88]
MPTPGFPAELWLQILSYLPQGTVRRMVSVSRTLYELYLDDFYKTIDFSSDSERMLEKFQRLRFESIARRVQYLHIRPTFFPKSNDGLDQSAFRRKIMLGIGRLRCRTAAALPRPLKMALQNPTFEVLDIPKRSLKHCQTIQELKITFRDQKITPSFLYFIDSLWAADSIRPNIKKLFMDTTLVELPLFLKPVVQFSPTTTNLQVFNLELRLSNIEHTTARWDRAIRILLSFFTAFKDTLSAITFSSEASHDYGLLFDSFPHIPHLKELQLLMHINEETFPRGAGSLTTFLSKHASDLEAFTVRPHPRFMTKSQSGDNLFYLWLNGEESTKSESIVELVFPNLHTFDVVVQIP